MCTRYYPFGVATHDVIVRFIWGRLGDVSHQEEDSIDDWNRCRDVILDHCSAAWSVDECLSTSGNDQDVTVQWCLIRKSLNHSTHHKGPHGYGSLARQRAGLVVPVHNDAGNPRLGDYYGRG